MADRNTITAADKLAIRERLTRYAWSMDRGDAAGVAANFTPDCVLTDARGQRFEGREGILRFANQAMTGKDFPGRQHHIKPLLFQADGAGYRVGSYYQMLRFPHGGAPSVLSLGWYEDRLRRTPEGWLIAAKVLRHWNEAEAPRSWVFGPEPLAEVRGEGATAQGAPAPADRIAMEDLMFAYATALDTGDLARMQATFAPGAVLESGGVGEVTAPEGIRKFLSTATSQPNFAGRQHRIYPLMFEPHGDGWRAFSYWKVETWTTGQPTAVVALGWYEDHFAKGPDGWRFARKAIRRWDSQSAPMAPAWSGPK